MKLMDALRLRLPGRLGYSRERDLIQHAKGKVRRRVAGRADSHPEVLYYLAGDPDSGVRAATAANPKTPLQADVRLARDPDDDVRLALARKVRTFAPGLAPGQAEKLQNMITEMIDILAADQLSRVRAALARSLSEVSNVPPEVARAVRALARDPDLSVAAPLLEFSPLLSEEDLLAIIRSHPGSGSLSRIASRRDLMAPVSDALVSTGDIPAVAELLANDSAQIREETLDVIADHAREIKAWHAPLVRRTQIPGPTLARIARFVSRSLLKELSRRTDLSPAVLHSIARVMEKRLQETDSDATAGEPPAARARRLHAAGELTADVLSEAVAARESAFIAAGLACLADLPEEVATKIIDSASARGITALVWKAGLGMRISTTLQMRVARVSPASVLHPKAGVDFPLSTSEMEWQISFFLDLGDSVAA